MTAASKVSLYVDGKELRFWESFSITHTIDSYSVVSFSAPWEPERKEHREFFRPFTYKPITVEIDNKLAFTGTMMQVRPRVSPDSRQVEVECYSKPGVISDCHPPEGIFPILETKGLKLSQIAEGLLTSFGVEVEMAADQGAAFDKVKCETTSTIHEFLSGLAKQRGLVMTTTAEGKLKFWQANPSAPVARLKEGLPPLLEVSTSFDPQQYYSQITAIADAKRGRKGTTYTARNPFLTDVVRPHNFQVPDTEPGDAFTAAFAKYGRMFADMIVYNVTIPTWRHPPDAPTSPLYDVNQTVTLTAPGAMVYSEYEFLTKSVTLRQSADSVECDMQLVVPGAYQLSFPNRLPWQES